jgi:aminobenzoyl-glutamate utilization protein B
MNARAKKNRVDSAVRAQRRSAAEVSAAVHAYAEPAFQEERSAGAIAAYLESKGFTVEFPFRKIPTAFRATRGQAGPVVGLLGEYDALPNCGANEGTWGHGCGHNLLGVAPAVGAVAASQVLEDSGARGKVVYYGCPAEETLAGKVYMARDGAFRDVDAVLAWHPGQKAGVSNFGGSALDSVVYEFFGRTAHGAAAHGGRSALDGVMLLDIAANYLREHVPENVRLHSVVRDGGDAPNVVPAYAKIWYYVRGKDRAQVDEVRERLTACARGAAEATGTEMKWRRLTAVYPRLPNDAMCALVRRNLELFGPPKATKSDRAAAADLGYEEGFDTAVAEGAGSQGRGSTDEDNVSWLAPLGRFQMVCYARGTPGHHRDLAAQAGMPYAQRACLQAGKVFAGATLDLCADKKALQGARAEFRKRTRGFTYDPLVPKRQPVPIGPP